VIAIIATVAKQERVRLSLRVRAGLEVARAKGKRIGRPPRTLLSEATRIAIAHSYTSGNTSLRELAKKFGTSLGTKRELRPNFPPSTYSVFEEKNVSQEYENSLMPEGRFGRVSGAFSALRALQ